MAHFQAGIKGNRGPATRLGTAKSGIYAFARGWQGGAHIQITAGDDGDDYILITVGPHHDRYQTTIVSGSVKDVIARAKSGGSLDLAIE